MKIHYWGTAAAEGIPGMFCACEVCKTARQEKGRHIRTRSQCLLDDELLIDFGPDTYAHSLRYGFSLSSIENVLITHTHEDHFYPQDLLNRREFYCYDTDSPTLKIYGSAATVKAGSDVIEAHRPSGIEQKRLSFCCLTPFEPKKVGSFTVTALPSQHGTEQPFIYLIEKEGKTVLYMHDSGYFKDEVLSYLVKAGVKIDLVSLDCTHADSDVYLSHEGDYVHIRHMGIVDNARIRDALVENKLVYDDTLYVCNHFSHNGHNVSYDEFKKVAEKHGFIPSYDGMELAL